MQTHRMLSACNANAQMSSVRRHLLPTLQQYAVQPTITTTHHRNAQHFSSSSSSSSSSRSSHTSKSIHHTAHTPQITHLSKPPSKDMDEATPLTETIRDFLSPADFYEAMSSRGLDFYTGVPDSLLKDYCSYVTDNAQSSKHVIAANEGASIAIAAGYYLATKKFPIVYMQNSGFGNAVNPLLSLCDPKVYSVPMLILCGYRGEPGKKDEPQHLVQGKVQQSMLSCMNVEYEVLPDYIEAAVESIDNAINYMKTHSAPYVFLIKRQTFTPYKLINKQKLLHSMTREHAIRAIVDKLPFSDIVVSTTGFASRELYEYRKETQIGHARDFLTVGCMGHASSIALGIALSKPDRSVYVLDGDGALLMHMGTLSTVGTVKPGNYKHILLNNGCHDSVGGQTTNGFNVNFTQAATACGYAWTKTASSEADLIAAIAEMRTVTGPAMLEVLINSGARKNLGRPKTTPKQNKEEFMKYLNQ